MSERDGDMGVSSERVGPTGPGQEGTSGTRDVGPDEPAAPTSQDQTPPDQTPQEQTPPEQTPAAVTGEPEVHPDPPIPPRSGYNSYDPRSD